MVSASVKSDEVHANMKPAYDRASEVKAFDETKAGVKGLVDAGITQIPRMFHLPPEKLVRNSVSARSTFSVPVIDLEGGKKDPNTRRELVEKICNAAKSWGLFQVVNHGVPVSVLEEMKDGALRFFEQDVEVKREFYSRDYTKKVVHNSNFDLYLAQAANWRDSLYCRLFPDRPNPEELPAVCREIMLEFSERIMSLGCFLLELLSEGLGLNPRYLKDIDGAKSLLMLCHYYPACPQPELTLGTSTHADSDFLTVLIQGHIGGLQVLHENQWVDVPRNPEALVINIGDLLRMISNDAFVSVEHRVLANPVGPRISVACFFSPGHTPNTRLYGPIKELLSEDNPPKYREITMKEYYASATLKGPDDTSALRFFRL